MIKNINANHKAHGQSVTRQVENKPQNVENQSTNKTIGTQRDSFAPSQAPDSYNNYSKDGDLLVSNRNKEISSKKRANINLVELMQQKRSEMSFFLDRLAEDRESAKAMADAYAEEAKRWQIVLEIFKRIMRGDKVPKSDEDFLAANSPALFMMAMVARQENENPKEHDPIAPSEDDEGADYSSFSENSSGNGSGSGATSNAQQATAASGQASSL